MAYIKEYWVNKEERAQQAKTHTERMERKYKNEINDSVKRSVTYDDDDYFWDGCLRKRNTEIIIENSDSVSAIFNHPPINEKIAVLNFASYKNPGGMFINGSKAQEECLCHESFLYNVLSRCDDFYKWNNTHKNRALYLNRALYTTNILFHHQGEECYCDVITCAAPNKSTAQKYQNVSNEENSEVLDDRIKFVLDVAKDSCVDILILGAFGCGVFGQDPKEVASIFKKYLAKEDYKCFFKVVFAIPAGKNLEAFQEVFND